MSYLLVEVDATPAARRVWKRDPDWWVPPLWRSEVLSVLVQSVRAQFIDEEQALACWRFAAEQFVPREIQPAEDGILEIALERNISAYDAHYVALATELRVPLVTGDQRIVRKCPDLAIAIEDFAPSS